MSYQECRSYGHTLPAAASCGDVIDVVRKTKGWRLSGISELNDQERIEELAQMAFTNIEFYAPPYKAAKDLLHQARRRSKVARVILHVDL